MLDNQLIYQSNASPPNRPRTKTQTTSKIDYRGITLKQYFRLVDKSCDHSTIQQLNEQQIHSSRNSFMQTPSFGNNQRQVIKQKLKTEINQLELENIHKNNNISLDQTKKLTKPIKNASIEKFNVQIIRKISLMKKPQKKAQKVKTLGPQITDRSTLSGFYKVKNICSNNHIQKRNKMLKKIQADRQRSQQMKQQDIFYITKYANKFHIDQKNLIQ